MCEWLPLCIYLCCMHVWCPWKSRKVSHPLNWLPCAGNLTCVPCKGNKFSWLLSHLFSLCVINTFFKLILKCKAWQMEGEVSFSVNIHTGRGPYPCGSMEPFKWLCSSVHSCLEKLSVFFSSPCSPLALHPSSFLILSNNSSVLTGSLESEEDSMLSDLWSAAF